ncbi:hypothetical protein AURDEDRAFT_130432 [Auricularia subglabra TFB-10046 SS5]|nr:hypothetical protein AURDEDRAFT_130432 [Auricularia subglabra TFB-10046 SS5]
MASTGLGTQVYVFCVLVNKFRNIIYDTSLQFILDDSPAGTFFYQADESRSDYIYDSLVFRSQSLPLREHVLEVINTAPNDQDRASLVLFDYIIYTYAWCYTRTKEDDPSPSPARTYFPPPAQHTTSGASTITPSISSIHSIPSSSDGYISILSSSSVSSRIPSSVLTSTSVSTAMPLSNPRATQRSIGLGAAAGGAAGGAVVIAVLLYGFYRWASIRRRGRAAITPASESTFPGNGQQQQHRGLNLLDEQAHISPYLSVTSTAMGDITDTGPFALKSEATDSARASTANGEELRREMERIRAEFEMLKQAVGPPQYTAPAQATSTLTQ